MAVDQGLNKFSLTHVVYLLLINAVVAVRETKMCLQSQVPVCSQWGGLLRSIFPMPVFKYS